MLKIDTIYKKGVLFIRPYGVINKVTKMELDKVLESVINKVGIKLIVIVPTINNIRLTKAIIIVCLYFL